MNNRAASAFFLGPKAENADILEELLLDVIRDVIFWRRNYFPGDPALLTKSTQRDLEAELDNLETHVRQMLADLRRNFPFHSPRYIAHQLSDVSIPALIGEIAGKLYNPNNATPEAAPVTTDWEIEVCSELLRMLGYRAPPEVPTTECDQARYLNDLRAGFGWAHLTSGGTSANIEALWIARVIRYFPLAVYDVAAKEKLAISVKLPSHAPDTTSDLRDLSPEQTILLKPNESIYLLAKLVKAMQEKNDLDAKEAADQAKEALALSDYGPSSGFFRAAAEYPPCLFVSGTSHYSVEKAADVIGIGRGNIEPINTDERFRMDPDDLRQKILDRVDQNCAPVAVIATVGTTAQGSVDPVHKVIELRRELERQGISFWVHVDAAWGGYFRTLFRLPPEKERQLILARIGRELGIDYPGNVVAWHQQLRQLAENSRANKSTLRRLEAGLRKASPELPPHEYLHALKSSLLDLRSRATLPQGDHGIEEGDFAYGLDDMIEYARGNLAEDVLITNGVNRRKVRLEWADPDVCSALHAFPEVESITVDPHKLGYVGYPCGVVAFSNDRVRHFVTQDAPYITVSKHNALLHNPPRHLEIPEGRPWSDGHTRVASLSPFTLEGSRPGSAASALRLSMQLMPLDSEGHGELIRSSVLAAQELWEWLRNWSRLESGDKLFEFIRYQLDPPDTNLVLFAVRPRGRHTIKSMNELTEEVYRRFSISGELGERDYSYSQPFFLSHTTLDPKHYPYNGLRKFFNRYEFRNAKNDYTKDSSLVALRASVMSPYIHALRTSGKQDVFREFIGELSSAARQAVTH
ncbi:pyridoxal phosphate-dependent decarboxylase family protein [Streptomyces sp. NPDC090445]|uniref:pyridoxal phosphate-dependent decarboxylase family protein n=1 Tax=Streptomyces sp. NPDC090445 TaxID=3365963 RepID=UPI00380011AC